MCNVLIVSLGICALFKGSHCNIEKYMYYSTTEDKLEEALEIYMVIAP